MAMDLLAFLVIGYITAIFFGIRWLIQQRTRRRQAKMSRADIAWESYLEGEMSREEYERIARQ